MYTASPIGATVYVRVHFIYQKLYLYAKSGLRFALGSTGEAKMGQAIVITN